MLIGLMASVGTAQALTLAKDGGTSYVIVVAPDAIAPEQTAAKELQTHLGAVTGAKFALSSPEGAPAGAKRIVVGPCAAFKEACPEVDLPALKHDGIALKVKGDTLYLAGGRPRGTLYAVYTFLEDTVGCRWWSSRPGEGFVPDRPTLEIGALDQVYVPKLQYREAFYRDAFDGVYAARSKCNGNFERVAPEYGGHYTLLGWCHTFYQLLPPEKYFARHQEWYSQVNGKRTADGAQLCLSNDEMRAELVRQALEWIKKDPSAGIISIAQNDCGGACQCDKCRQMVQEEGAESGAVIRFVNQVAAEIEKQYPNFWVETLAYNYTRQPPKLVRPRDNVVVRLCSIECSFSQPLETGPQNATFKRDLEGWSAIAPHLYIWDYVTNFSNYILPHPNLRVLAPNIRTFVKNHAIGLFEQGDAGCSCSDFPELRAWLLAHLMWDPSRDEKALTSEFLRGYYGAAADALQQYIDLNHDAAQRSGVYLSCGMNDTSAWLTLEDLNRATELFSAAAERVKDDPALSARVRRARMPLDHAWLQRYRALRLTARLTHKPYLGPADPAAFCEDFIRSAHAFDVGQCTEGQPFANLELGLRALTASGDAAATRPKEAEGVADEDWFDVQEGMMTLYNLGSWVTVVDDPKASNGKAARMPGGHRNWATQYAFSGDLANLGKWHCYVVARCEARAKEGAAFQVGLYDGPGRTNVAGITETIEHAGDGQYRTYDLGVHELKGGLYFWAAPMGNADQVDAVYVDRMFCVREKGG